MKKITWNGKSGTLRWWARQAGISESTLRSRLAAGWPLDRVFAARPDERFSRIRKAKPKRVRPVPRMLHRKSDGTAVLDYVIAGQRHFIRLGKWGSPEAVQAYARFCADWIAGRSARPASGGMSVAELIEDFLIWAEPEYRKGDRQTSELNCCRAALRLLNRDYGLIPVAEFGPQHLEQIQRAWAEEGYSVGTIRRYRSRVIRVFRRGQIRGAVSADQLARIGMVATVKPGRTGVPSREDRRDPVPESDFRKTLEHLSERLQLAAQVQWLTGCRPVEVCSLRGRDLDRSSQTWKWTIPIEVAKTAHLGKTTVYRIGPKCQALLAPILAAADPGDYLFRARKSVNQPMDRSHYGRQIQRAARRAGVRMWTPHQLRHTRATAAAAAVVAAAAAAIGDTQGVTLRHYLSEDQIAIQIALFEG